MNSKAFFSSISSVLYICVERKAHIGENYLVFHNSSYVEWSNLHLFPLRRVGSGLSQINLVSADQIRPLDPVNLSDGRCSLPSNGMWSSAIKLPVINQLLYNISTHRLLTVQFVFINEHHRAYIFVLTKSPILFYYYDYYSINMPAEKKLWLFYSLAICK